jgi:hypothetical protein
LSDPDFLRSGESLSSFFESVELNGLTLNFGGSISGIEYLLGWDEALFPDGGPIESGVRVRQITAVLDISFAWSNSGSNVAVSVVSDSNAAGTLAADSELRAALATVADFGLFAAPGTGDAQAFAGSGDALAVGNHAVIVICQTFRDSLACAP